VVGYHGRSRNGNKFRTSSFILARVPDEVVVKAALADPNTLDEERPLAASYRLSEALLAAPDANAFFARGPMTKNGYNIEGLAVVAGRPYGDLRAPVIGKKAYLVEVELDALFDADQSISLGKKLREIELDFLEGRGIRHLAVLTDRRLLILSGPTQANGISFALYAVDTNKGSFSPIAVLLSDIPTDLKTEGPHVLRQEPSSLDILIVLGRAEEWCATRYSIELK
jgi:Protein of unknown function (DUF3616)